MADVRLRVWVRPDSVSSDAIRHCFRASNQKSIRMTLTNPAQDFVERGFTACRPDFSGRKKRLLVALSAIRRGLEIFKGKMGFFYSAALKGR